MKNKSILIYSAVFVVLLILVYFIVIDRGGKTTSYSLAEKLFTVDSASVTKIEFEEKGQKYVFELVGNEWRMTEPLNKKLEQKFIPSLLSDLQNSKIESIVSENPSAHVNFGFIDTNVVRFKIFKQGEMVADFEIGNASEGAAQTFIKLPGDEKVYLASGFLRNNFVRQDANDWRDKSIFSIPAVEIEKVEFNFPDEKFDFTWDSTGNYYVGGEPADTAAVDGFLNLMQNFNTQTFWDEPLNVDESFNYRITLYRKEKEPVTLYLKKLDNETDMYLLKVSNIDQVFKFNSALANNLIHKKNDYLAK